MYLKLDTQLVHASCACTDFTSSKSSLGEQHQLEAALSSIKHNVEKENQRFKNFKRQVERLIDVPCGDSFPGCQYILSAQKANKKLSAQNTKIEELKDDLKETRKHLKKLLDQDLEAKLDRYDELIAKYNDVEIEKSQLALKTSKEQVSLKNAKETLNVEDASLDEMKANLSTDDAAMQIKRLRQKLSNLKKRASASETKHAALSEAIGLLNSDITKLRDDKAASN